ncbi:RHS repeat-associated core domain-containing protein [Pseudomonas sp. KNUC1026]|uniref:RHS repeat-associated core domain-containing protein n=1 Tax=Pseudomonas sp. KNUC1026 TaxID=2893890 RepID=UPI001F3B6A6D|nr:RHS repeat-associated core domain-containing protein [Pseudomonas sp. KNUC1026]UFH48821.1 RHS repeat-associated core domain-containing protein [Pseudomonas sp. KNUC1026]
MHVATDCSRSVIRCGLASVGYTPFGVRPSIATRVGFNGELVEPRRGDYLLGAGHRQYVASLGRFASPDVLSPMQEGGMNAYAFCQADPVNYSDPSGRSFIPTSMFMKELGQIAADVRGQTSMKTLIPLPTREYVSRVVELRRGHPFNENLRGVNRNFLAAGREGLSPPHAELYDDLSAAVYAGDISGTTAAWRTGMQWAHDAMATLAHMNASGPVPGAVVQLANTVSGAATNFASLSMMGAIDHIGMKRYGLSGYQSPRHFIRA